MSAWGRTGRVTLGYAPLAWVHVDGDSVGWLYEPDDNHPQWGARARLGNGDLVEVDDLPSRDAAVMWVLAHALGNGTDADRKRIRDTWRAERGDHVWHVWTTPAPADPFGPFGPAAWQWYAGPTRDFTVLPPLWDGPNTPHRGDRTWLRNAAHALRRTAHLAATHERTHP